jgi:hypothetical protein
MIWNSAHRKPSMVFFNSSSGTTITKAVNVQHISIFGMYEVAWHFSQHSYNVASNSHNNQLKLHTDSHASDSGKVIWEGWIIFDVKSELLYNEVAVLTTAAEHQTSQS